MTVTVDDRTLPADQLGLRTIGQVLAHLQRDNRLVVQLLIDGHEPNLDAMADVRQSPLAGHTLYIETADPREVACQVLDELDAQLAEADRLKTEAAEAFQHNQSAQAMERLSGCFGRWHSVQEAIGKTVQLLRIDATQVRVGERDLTALYQEFSGHVRALRAALEARDFVTVTDLLLYETADASDQWRQVIVALRAAIPSDGA